MMIAPKLLYVFVMAMSATLAFLPHQAAASDFELLTPGGPGICPSGTAVTEEDCFDAVKEVDDGVDASIPFIINTWDNNVPCGCSNFIGSEDKEVFYNRQEGICSANAGNSDFSLVCRKTTAGGGGGKF
jgi:hypothetical protein